MATTSSHSDGGYYAIKGFTYQFDKSLLEVFANPTTSVRIEQIQDIAVNDYYIQVKYKEAAKYADSKVRDPIVQLLDLFIADKTKRFCLYCYFKDRPTERKSLTEAELDSILGTKKSSYKSADKKAFMHSFDLIFSDDFEGQFAQLIADIKSKLKLRRDEEATMYHALFRAHLLEVAVKRDVRARTVDFKTLSKLARDKEKLVFELAYSKYLTNERYIKYLRGAYFTFSKVNIPKKERLFVIEVDTIAADSDISQIVHNIQSRYFKKDTSPAPYICIDGIPTDRLRALKQMLWDQDLFFIDGTHFDGDKYRPGDLTAPPAKSFPKATFKVVSRDGIPALISTVAIQETYVFTVSADSADRWWRKELPLYKEFYITNSTDIEEIIRS